jgi:regulator of protease activity HflC (stomatin/prohibitin superfamily)
MLGRLVATIVAVLVLVFGVYTVSCWEKVPAGNVGIKVYLLGTDRGVDNEVLGVGRQWIGWQQELYLYPTFTQNDSWTGNEGMTFQDKDGLNISSDIGISYHVDPSKAAVLFQKYRKGIDEISQLVIRRYVQDSLVRHASVMSVEEINGPQKSRLLQDVQIDVAKQLASDGLVVEKLTWIGRLGLPETVQEALNAKITATQKALTRENEVAQAQAQANIERAKAQGDADAKLTMAKAEAQSIQIKGDALRQNQELVNLTLAERWDGHYPGTLFIGADQGKLLLQVPQSSK